MAFLDTVRILVLTILVAEVDVSEQEGVRKSYDAICKNVTNDPFFEDKKVIGKPWRVYYTWNMKLDGFCMEFTFKYADKSTVSSLNLDTEKMKIAPLSSKEILLISVTSSPDMLLFNDPSGIPGLFVGMICDIADSKYLQQNTHKMALKLFNEGQYLIMTDCKFGTTSLSVRKDNRPKRSEIQAVVNNFTFGDPFPACVSEKDPDK